MATSFTRVFVAALIPIHAAALATTTGPRIPWSPWRHCAGLQRSSSLPSLLRMGLYDEPLPDRPSPPDGNDSGGTDWDAELKSLLERKKGGPKPKIVRQVEQEGDDGPKYNEEGTPKPRDAEKEGFTDFTKFTEWGPDDKFIPGKSNPRPVDDEPWFTG
eukprot:CAMPEP_0113565520 /NCGR_PEP_ID=MMETSP0015_2-20120614/22222_1 /TAXON_ID=2838 /ORGANISM="Odontella" /LENGTH=158 /DNA_ID=CAMNT_0000467725 /DNA_START=57 /DNA_END=533 /DNA_ORIENTATION=+ /assembly_acc=CAM_ASM_000160